MDSGSAINVVHPITLLEQGTNDFRHWQSLSKSLERVSTMTDGAEASLEVSSCLNRFTLQKKTTICDS